MNGDIVWGDAYAWGSPSAGLAPATLSVSVQPTLIQQKTITGLVCYERQGDAVRTVSLNGTVTAMDDLKPMDVVESIQSLVDMGYIGFLCVGNRNLGSYIATSFSYQCVHISQGFVQTLSWSLTLSECETPKEEKAELADAMVFDTEELTFESDAEVTEDVDAAVAGAITADPTATEDELTDLITDRLYQVFSARVLAVPLSESELRNRVRARVKKVMQGASTVSPTMANAVSLGLSTARSKI